MKKVFKPLTYALMVIVILFELVTTSSIAATPEYGSLTRGDVVYWLFNTFLPDIESTANLTDTQGKYYAEAAEWAYNDGFVYGIDEGVFAGDRAITRIELAAIFVRMAEAAYSSRYDLVCRDLNEYSDANMVPDWARHSISIALEYEIIEANGNRIDPLGYVDYCMVTNALNAVYAINNLNILTDSTSYRGAYFRNINNGSALHLGMHMDNVAGVAGVDVKNWSAVGNDDIRMNIMRSRVVSIFVSTVDWKWNDSLQVGMMKSEVEEILGEPKPPLEPYGIPRGLPFYYLFDSEGNVVESDSDASYSLEISYDDNSIVTGMNLCVTANAAYFQEAKRSIFVNSAVRSHNQGHGESTVVVNLENGPVYDVKYIGENEFLITDSVGNEMFSHFGSFNGRILLHDIPSDGIIAIKSDGYWELTALNIRTFAKFFYSGHGNFVFWNIFNQYNFKSDTKIAFTHYGSGEFLLNNVNISSQLEQQVVEKLAEGIGYQTVILEIPPYSPSLTYCFEIITDGRWSFEFVTEG